MTFDKTDILKNIPKESCGIFGVYGNEQAVELVYEGIYTLQHRGQESAGIAWSDGNKIHKYGGIGLIESIFDIRKIKKNKAKLAIGHNRYSTSGGSEAQNIGPLVIDFRNHSIALAHNGNMPEYEIEKNKMEVKNSIFHTTTDTEIILHKVIKKLNSLLNKNKKSYLDDYIIISSIKETFDDVHDKYLQEGAYSLLFLTKDKLIAIRDPNGYRPLVIGALGKSTIIASETCALNSVNAKYIKEIEPGQVVIIGDKDTKFYNIGNKIVKKKDWKCCAFEHIYFSRPDSIVFGQYVNQVRGRLGGKLALKFGKDFKDIYKEKKKVKDKNNDKENDSTIIINVPDSSNIAAVSFANKTRLEYRIGFYRNPYISRTFIEPDQCIREKKALLKYSILEETVKGRNIIIVDDSIIRGTTLIRIVKQLRDAGAKKIHIRISSPPVFGPCRFGMDFQRENELLVNRLYSLSNSNNRSNTENEKNVDIKDDKKVYKLVQNSLNKIFDSDSIDFLSVKEMIAELKLKDSEFEDINYCTDCFLDLDI